MLIKGALNTNNAVRLIAEGQKAIHDAAKECRMDLAELEMVDSAGIAVLLAWERYARRQHKKLILTNPPETLLSMLELYDLKTLILK